MLAFAQQMKKRTIERKSKDGFLNSMAKNLGLKPKDDASSKTETVREFDDLIETLRTGKRTNAGGCDSFRAPDFHNFVFITLASLQAMYFTAAKSTNDLAKQKVATATHHPETIAATATRVNASMSYRRIIKRTTTFIL